MGEGRRLDDCWRLAPVCLAALLTTGCASELRRFPLRPPIWKDPDLREVVVPCRDDDDPKAKKGDRVCIPAAYASPYYWDGANQTFFRPMSRFWAVDPAGDSVNVNSLDEVPDSSWFTNRIGLHAMSEDEVARGACAEGPLFDPYPAQDGAWLIDMGKEDGANAGFRINVPGVGKFMMKIDRNGGDEKETAATTIATRLYHAAGWNVPCERVVYVRSSVFSLKPGLVATTKFGEEVPFDHAALERVFRQAAREGERLRFMASRWLPGRSLGPHTYSGVRRDDPNDVIPHEDRRDLRGSRVIAAWLGHWDSREQNSLDTWMSVNPKKAGPSPGHVVHWLLDFGDCFGRQDVDELDRRSGFSYLFDPGLVLTDTLSLGAIERPWDHVARDPRAPLFNYFSAADFDPDGWRTGYPNPAFARMAERDAAWAARILARFSFAQVEAAVRAGGFTEPRHAEVLAEHIMARRRKVLTRYLTRISPLTDVEVQGHALCALDLARASGVSPPSAYHYAATARASPTFEARARVQVTVGADGLVCVELPRANLIDSDAVAAPPPYVVVEITNGQAQGALVAHLYDLGPAGFRLAGVERPD